MISSQVLEVSKLKAISYKLPDYIDIHSHVNFAAYDADREDVIARALVEKVWMINVGTQKDTSKQALDLADAHEGVFAIVGVHPIHTGKSYHDEKELGAGNKDFTSRGEEFDTMIYRSMLTHPKVVGIGECGLDYYRLEEDSIEKQKKAFEAQIALANEVVKPLMLHIRNNPKGGERSAYRDAYEILKSTAKVKGDVHFFAGSWEEAKPFLELGFTLSFTGVITFARDYDEVIRNAPLDMILSETDSPYVTPAPYRGKRNEPLYVKEVVKKIAEIRGEDFEKVRTQLVGNALRLFSLT